MNRGESKEDYLKAILIVTDGNRQIRAVDLARYMGFSKPSVTTALRRLVAEDCISVDDRGFLSLTELGRNLAGNILARYRFFEQMLLEAGVRPEIAKADAHRLEHAVSADSYDALKRRSCDVICVNISDTKT